ncbi:MAG TPA: branched-chain amino acid ABC transporter permease [Trueperaceae bacterium]|nr:branched-chain amino acid ABC transporter permease [Trueperaceae bacterium]
MALSAYLVGLLTLALIYGVMTLGLHLQFGLAGMLNFGHVAFFAVGAFTSALLSLPPKGSEAYLAAGGQYQLGVGLPVPLAFVAAGVAAGLLALLIGATSVRLSSHYLAVATFAMAEIVRSVLTNEDWLTRGQFGIYNVPQPGRGGPIPIDLYPYAYLLLTVVVVGILLAVTVRLTASPFGRALRAVRDDEVAALALGKPAAGLKLRAFALGGALAGLAGALWTHSLGIVHVGQFVPIITFQVWLALLLGGRGNPVGAVLGAIVLMAITEATRFLGNVPFFEPLTRLNPSFVPSLRFVIIGLMLIAVVRYFPRGIMPERLRPPPPGKLTSPEQDAA